MTRALILLFNGVVVALMLYVRFRVPEAELPVHHRPVPARAI